MDRLRPFRVTLLFALAVLLAAAGAAAAPLDVVEVGAPDVNCVFDVDCRITVSDFVDTFVVPAASGDGRLQSRTQPPGEAGTQGAGLYAYEYRVNLTPVGALTAVVCVDELRVDFGPVESLDYDGDGRAEHVYVVTRGGLGSVRPSSVDLTGSVVTFRFQPAVCPGNRAGAGETSFFFGLASRRPPRELPGQVGFNAGPDVAVDVRVPQEGPSIPPPDDCVVGVRPHGPVNVPIPRWTPACRCFQDATLREFRCALVHPDLVVVWEGPFPVPPGDPFAVRWTLISGSERGGGKLTVTPEKGFEPIGRESGFTLPPGSPPHSLATDRVWLLPAGKPGKHLLEAEILLPKGANRPAVSLDVSFPLMVGGGGQR